MNWKRWFGLGSPPEVKMQAHDLQLNPPADVRAARNRARIGRLYKMISEGDTRPELREELDRLMGKERR